MGRRGGGGGGGRNTAKNNSTSSLNSTGSTSTTMSASNETNNSNQENTTPPETTDPKALVTFADLDALLAKHLNKHLDKTVESLQASINTVTQVANNALALVEKLEAKIKVLEESNKELSRKIDRNSTENKETVKLIEKNHTEVLNRVREVEERLEERTNRQLRKTLVFRGIEEKPAGEASETWEESRVKVAKAISEVCGPEVDEEAAYDMIERCHRSARNPRYDGPDPRPIFAAITYWPDTVTITDGFRKKNISKNISNSPLTISTDQ